MYPWCLSAFNMMFIKINIIMINKNDNNNLEIAHPLSGSSSTWFMVMLVFWGVGKTGVPRVKSLQAKERTNIKLKPHMVSSWFYHQFKFNWRLFSLQPLWRLINFVFNFYTLGAYNKVGSWKGGGGLFLCHRVEAYYDGHLSGVGSNNMVTNMSCF